MTETFESTGDRASGVFARFCDCLAKVDLRMALAVPAAIGAVAALYGVGLEVHGQSELLRQGGIAAVDAYNAAMQANPVDSAMQYVNLAFRGELPSFGGNAQGMGIGTAVAGPIIGSASVLLARGFNKTKEFMSAASDSFSKSLGCAGEESGVVTRTLKTLANFARNMVADRAERNQLDEIVHNADAKLVPIEDGRKYTGKIVAVTENYALQHLGRDWVARHRLSAIGETPQVGQMMRLSYDSGKVNNHSNVQGRSLGNSR